MFNQNKNIYLDYAATTPVDKRVVKAMTPYFTEKYGNSESIHTLGRQAKKALEEARETVAYSLGANPQEIIFTASATESNNTALKGIAWSHQDEGNHIIISPIEHSCVRKTAFWLKERGFEVEELDVDEKGQVDPQQVRDKIKDTTLLVSVMYGNNEIGTIEPIKEIGAICDQENVLFHSDVVQNFGKMLIDVNEMNIDLLSISAHKIYGPKGVGVLFLREGIDVTPLLHGGGHEEGLRSSTVNVPGIVGLAQAVELCQEEHPEEIERQARLRDKLIDGILDRISGSEFKWTSRKEIM